MLATKYRLPLAVTIVAALVYGLTLCRGTTANSLGLVASVAGWDWSPLLNQPVVWLLTLPSHLLPTAWVPASLNLIFALGGALTLGILTRSIQLLPWDCQPPENRKWIKLLPALLAAGVCGLEINFWQEATNGCGVMINQLLLAAASWCLLEYRIAKDSRWLNRAAVIWGAGMAQSWVMQLDLPLFIAAVITLRRARFFKVYFLIRTALFGLAGFAIYALPPIVIGLTPHASLGLGAAWVETFRASKDNLRFVFNSFWAQNHLMILVVILFYLLPVLPTLVRLPDRGSNNKSKLDRWQMRLYRFVRGGLLLGSIWLVFEPRVGPQQILMHRFGLSLPLLSFAYLNAIGIAFLAGNLLFALQIRPEPGKLRGLARKINSWRRRSVPFLFGGFFALILLALGFRNASVISSENRQPLEDFGAWAANSLPSEGGILLGDDLVKLAAVQSALAHRSGGRWQAVALPLLASPEYRASLERQQSLGWITEQSRHNLIPLEQYRLLNQMAQARRIFGLQLPPGQLLFEQFYAQPTGAVVELKRYEPFQSGGPLLTGSEIAAGEKFWDDTWDSKMAARISPAELHHSAWSRYAAKLNKRLGLEPVPELQSQLLASWYSAALNSWGVQLQLNSRLPAAQHRFEQVLALVTNNICAAVNLECNTNLQAAKRLTLAGANNLAAQLQDLNHLVRVMRQFGPIDQPAVSFLMGRECQMIGWPRQALQQLGRAVELAPLELPPKLAQAEIYSRYRQDDRVFALLKQIRASLSILPTNEVGHVAMELDLLEAKSWMSQTNLTQARRILEAILEKAPDDLEVQNLVMKAYLSFGDLTNALQLVSRQLAAKPDNTELLNRQAGIFMELNQPTNALAILDRALAITNLPNLRLNHAHAYLQSGDLAKAEAEFQGLAAQPPDLFLVHFGLASLARLRHDTNLAIQHWQICFTNSPLGSARWLESRTHLAELKPDKTEPPVQNSP